jgi:hypothetical protein
MTDFEESVLDRLADIERTQRALERLAVASLGPMSVGALRLLNPGVTDHDIVMRAGGEGGDAEGA